MERLKHKWRHIHPSIRKPVVLVVGSILIVAAAATGWLPGPGGIPLFLVGIAILATEFVWAERIRDKILVILHIIGKWFRRNKALGITLCVLGAAAACGSLYFFYFR